MEISKKFSIMILDYDNIPVINKILVEYADSTRQSSSHELFKMEPINTFDVALDLSYFRLNAEDETHLNNKLQEIIDKLIAMNLDYTIIDDETKELHTSITSISALDIKFDNLKIIPEGTYKQLDEIKNTKTEFGYCKGYKPAFRLVESKEIGNIELKPETVYLLSNSPENHKKLKKYVSDFIMKINHDFIIEFRDFI